MNEFWESIGGIGFGSAQQIVTGVVRLVLAGLCGALIGIERGRKHRPAGLRTHTLVCIAAALVMVTNEQMIYAWGTGDPTRMGAQVISGIGFLGAGTILIDRQNRVRGLTTAAGLWASACVGLAIGAGYYIGGLLVCGMMLLVFVKFIDVEQKLVHRSRVMEIYVEFEEASQLNTFLAQATANDCNVLDCEIVTASKKKNKDGTKRVAANISLWAPRGGQKDNILQTLEQNAPGLITLEEY